MSHPLIDPLGRGGRRVAGLGAIALCGGLLLSACGTGSAADSASNEVPTETAQMYEAAQKEKPLTLYSSQTPDQIEALLTAFNKTYPKIKVDPVRAASGALSARYASEQDAGACVADTVIIGDPLFMDVGAEEGWWTTVTAQDLPNLAAWPEKYLSASSIAHVVLAPLAISTNTDDIPADKAPKTIKELADPSLKGRLLLVDPRSTLGWMSVYDMIRKEYGDDFLSRMVANATLVTSAVPGTQKVAAGENSVLFPTIKDAAKDVEAQGAPVVTNVIQDGLTSGTEQSVAIPKCTDSPTAAKLLMNFIMSKEGQSVLTAKVASSPLGDVPEALPLPKEYVSNTDSMRKLTEEDQRKVLDLFKLS